MPMNRPSMITRMRCSYTYSNCMQHACSYVPIEDILFLCQRTHTLEGYHDADVVQKK